MAQMTAGWNRFRGRTVDSAPPAQPEWPDCATGPEPSAEPPSAEPPSGTALPATTEQAAERADPEPAAPRPGPAVPGTRARDAGLWLWPVAAVVVMALAGAVEGAYGALVACIAVTATVVLFVGYRVLPPPLQVGIAGAGILGLGAVLVGHSAGVGLLAGASATATAGSSRTLPAYPDQRGRHVTAAMVNASSMRGSSWPGAIFDSQPLRDADLTGLVAPGASMRETTLDGAHLSGADLRGADMAGVHLRAADLRGADLRGADLRHSDLRDACLVGADLTGALLDSADASRAAVAAAAVTPAAKAKALDWPSAATADAAGCPKE